MENEHKNSKLENGNEKFILKLKKPILPNNKTMKVIRTNPHQVTNQHDMVEFIKKHQILPCPFGHTLMHHINIQSGIYNYINPPMNSWSSNGQDEEFSKNLRINEIIIVLSKLSEYPVLLVIKIASELLEPNSLETLQDNTEQLYVYYDNKDTNKVLKIEKKNKQLFKKCTRVEYFKPYFRKIEVLKVIKFPEIEDKRFFSRRTISSIDNKKIMQINYW